MDELVTRFQAAKVAYDAGENPLDLIKDVCVHAVALTKKESAKHSLGTLGSKKYETYKVAANMSRPVNKALFVDDTGMFGPDWDALVESIDGNASLCTVSTDEANKVLYTAVMSFAVCYDGATPQGAGRQTPRVKTS